MKGSVVYLSDLKLTFDLPIAIFPGACFSYFYKDYVVESTEYDQNLDVYFSKAVPLMEHVHNITTITKAS